MSAFVDTSAFYAILDADDKHHREAAGEWRELMTSGQDVVTTNYVLLETFALLQARLGVEAVREFHGEIVPILRIEYITAETHRLGMAALLGAARRGLSLVDCTSFEVMREQGIRTAFAFDSHFQEYGFTTLP